MPCRVASASLSHRVVFTSGSLLCARSGAAAGERAEKSPPARMPPRHLGPVRAGREVNVRRAGRWRGSGADRPACREVGPRAVAAWLPKRTRLLPLAPACRDRRPEGGVLAKLTPCGPREPTETRAPHVPRTTRRGALRCHRGGTARPGEGFPRPARAPRRTSTHAGLRGGGDERSGSGRRGTGGRGDRDDSAHGLTISPAAPVRVVPETGDANLAVGRREDAQAHPGMLRGVRTAHRGLTRA
jgi:hypothetical protein